MLPCGSKGSVFCDTPGGSLRRRWNTSFSNLHMARSPARGLPVSVARRGAVMTIGASVCRGKARYACGDGLNPVELIKSLGKLGGIAWPTWTAENGAGPVAGQGENGLIGTVVFHGPDIFAHEYHSQRRNARATTACRHGTNQTADLTCLNESAVRNRRTIQFSQDILCNCYLFNRSGQPLHYSFVSDVVNTDTF